MKNKKTKNEVLKIAQNVDKLTDDSVNLAYPFASASHSSFGFISYLATNSIILKSSNNNSKKLITIIVNVF